MIAQLLTGWRGVLFSALLIGSVAGSAAWEIRGWQTASVVGAATAAQARAEKDLSDLRAVVANNLADMERVRADEQAKALSAAKAQTRRLLELQTRLAQSERERIEMSAKAKETLIHAPTDDARDLGPAVLRYLDRVRAEQSAR